MNKKIVFALALALALGMAGCGSKDAASSGAASSEAASGAVSSVIDEELLNQPASPDEGPADEPAVSMPTVDAETGEQTNKPADLPAEKPAATDKQTSSNAASKPTQSTTQDKLPTVSQPVVSAPAAPSVSITDVAASVESAMGELPGLMELDAETMNFLYGIDASALESFVCKMPMMNVHATEYFVAKVKSGSMDAVKAGIDKRIADMSATWEHYLADQYELVKNAKVVTSGDYILFVVANEADAAANAFTAALA